MIVFSPPHTRGTPKNVINHRAYSFAVLNNLECLDVNMHLSTVDFPSPGRT